VLTSYERLGESPPISTSAPWADTYHRKRPRPGMSLLPPEPGQCYAAVQPLPEPYAWSKSPKLPGSTAAIQHCRSAADLAARLVKGIPTTHAMHSKFVITHRLALQLSNGSGQLDQAARRNRRRRGAGRQSSTRPNRRGCSTANWSATASMPARCSARRMGRIGRCRRALPPLREAWAADVRGGPRLRSNR